MHRLNDTMQKKYEDSMKKQFNMLIDNINASSINPITPFYTTTDNFMNSKDRLIIEAKNTGFCIFGNMLYYESILKNEF